MFRMLVTMPLQSFALFELEADVLEPQSGDVSLLSANLVARSYDDTK